MSATPPLLCLGDRGVLDWTAFASDVWRLRGSLGAASHVCNLCADRYGFMVLLAAALLEGRPVVLPSADAPDAIAAALADADSPVVVRDLAELDQRREAAAPPPDRDTLIAALARCRTPVHVFTSGSTRAPRVHTKTWEMLAAGAGPTAEILARLGLVPGRTALLGTTPHQHMYGFEATVFAALAHGHAVWRRSLFYPADVERALDAVLGAGFDAAALVTSPAHIRYLEPVILASPAIAAVISATAPLPRSLASRLEARGNLAVMEVYGSTETGSLAIRRTAENELWEPLAGFSLHRGPSGWLARAPHLPEAVPLGDDVRPGPDGRFALLGRRGDMVNVNGKRTSLAALNAILLDTPGLADAVMLHEPGADNDRLAIVAVPATQGTLDETALRASVRAHMRRHCDGAFVPRRIVFLDRLPRSEVGKIPERALAQLRALTGLAEAPAPDERIHL